MCGVERSEGSGKSGQRWLGGVVKLAAWYSAGVAAVYGVWCKTCDVREQAGSSALSASLASFLLPLRSRC